jgi:N-acetylmuramoyl-L-alanine amidase
MRVTRVLPALLIVLGVAASGVAAPSAADLYRAALAREQAVRARLNPGAKPTPAILGSLRAAVRAYEVVVLRYPRSGYCDNALWRGAQLASDAFTYFGEARDRSTAVRLIHWLQKEYPHSRYARMAPSAPAPPVRQSAAEPRHPEPTRKAPDAAAPRAAPPATAPRRAAANAAALPPQPPAATLQSVVRAVLPDRVRITLTLDHEVLYREVRDYQPDRLIFQLPRTRPAPPLKYERLTYRTEAVPSVSVTPATVIGTNVNIDLEGVKSYSTFVLYNPYRLVIDCLTMPAPSVPSPRPAAASVPAPPAPLEGDRNIEAAVLGLPSAVANPPELDAGAGAPVKAARMASTRLTVSPYPVPDADRPSAQPLRHKPAGASPATAGAATAGAALAAGAAAIAPAEAAPTPGSTATRDPAVASTARPPATNLNGGFSMARQLGLGVSRIVIDPGHGGRDPGVEANGITEADLTLDIALRLKKLLEKQPGIQVILTRSTNVFVPLEERTAIANRAGADLFLSIHANASRNPQASGVETYFLNFASSPEEAAVAARENATSGDTMGNLPDLVKAIALNNKLDESRDFATMIQNAMFSELSRKDTGLKDRGVKQAPFAVLIGASMPSVLAEVSFVTNPDDARYLKRGSYQEQIAESLLNGILRYQHALKSVRTADNQ